MNHRRKQPMPPPVPPEDKLPWGVVNNSVPLADILSAQAALRRLRAVPPPDYVPKREQ